MNADESTEIRRKDRRAALLDTLPARQREIMRLRLVVGLTAQETADRLGMAPSAVRMAQHRALDQLRKSMEDPPAG